MGKDNCNIFSYYDEYLNKILDITKLTAKENSILINFSVDGSKCHSKVELLEQNGTIGTVKKVSFACTESFYSEFLEKLLIEYISISNVVLIDIIDMDGDNKFTLRVVGEFNDLFSIDGISKDYAYKLKKMIEDFKEKKSDDKLGNNELGISNTLGLLVLGSMTIVIILTLMLFIW